MKIYNLLFIMMVCLACESKQAHEVKHYGTLRSIKHEGDVSGKVELDTLVKTHLYGLGALAGIKGEITLIDGQTYVSKVIDSTAVLGSTTNVEAALFVFSYVHEWDTVSVEGGDDLELLISANLEERNDFAPTPFMIIGRPDMVDYHIVNLDPKSENKADHKAGSFTDTIEKRQLTLVGFYANDAQGVYTHHDSNIHVHFVEESSSLTGHVDDVVLGEGEFKLLIPKP
ncbi:acetolactate decarboxylase [Fulvivirga lutimaris]|uniref:acetolactate decarboxylase n=1 Tax=Fulvivirga lutimaris TaxID=1819566 RepID=UPI0012BCFCAA|nr:acetolactate decarboxylase [Fulvivirga lutimaris]MTI41429.1 hypothetical protein [Fulvivirga lutimaris]